MAKETHDFDDVIAGHENHFKDLEQEETEFEKLVKAESLNLETTEKAVS